MERAVGSRPSGIFSHVFIHTLSNVLNGGIRLLRLDRAAYKNALDIDIVETELVFDTLPKPFDGFSILHLSDFHFDVMPILPRILAERLRGATVDLVALTGDFTDSPHVPPSQIVRQVKISLRGITTGNGILATLGNHDSHAIVRPFEENGIRFLINETMTLSQDGHSIQITGLDDVNLFETWDAHRAIRDSGDGFKVLLVQLPKWRRKPKRLDIVYILQAIRTAGRSACPAPGPSSRWFAATATSMRVSGVSGI